MTYRPAAVQMEAKHPREAVSYALDFARWLATGDSLASIDSFDVDSGLTLTPSGKASPAIVGTTVAFWLGGGADGTTYAGEIKVTTADGEELVASFAIEIVDPAPNLP